MLMTGENEWYDSEQGNEGVFNINFVCIEIGDNGGELGN